MPRDVALALKDMRAACTKIAAYIHGRSRHESLNDEAVRDAVLWNIHVLGEAAKRVPVEFRERHAEIPWRKLTGLRDVVAHEYFALDDDILWDIVTNKLPEVSVLLDALRDA